ncbi:MAG: hypothetical protein FWG10_11615 [Eubacteriaceae bacterium]|nr:hypothetical protein [Eubacteriaceae bacterium]
MIHIIRHNEDTTALSKLYSVEEQDILKANPFEPVENLAIWLPTSCQYLFLKEPSSLLKIARNMSLPIDEMQKLNGDIDIELPRNTKIALPSQQSSAFAIFATTSAQGALMAPHMPSAVKGIFIDEFSFEESGLRTEYDPGGINACLSNNIQACFVAKDLNRYLDRNIYEQLLHDLLYKEYTAALLFVEPGDVAAFHALKESLNNYGLNLYVAGDFSTLNSIGGDERAKGFFLRQSSGAFDFETFTESISALANKAGHERMGYHCELSAVQIIRHTGQWQPISTSQLAQILGSAENPNIRFDSESQLCHTARSSSYGPIDVLFEDFRSLYAKLAYMRDIDVPLLLCDESSMKASIIDKMSRLRNLQGQ